MHMHVAPAAAPPTPPPSPIGLLSEVSIRGESESDVYHGIY